MPLPPAPGHRAAKLPAEAFLSNRKTAKQTAALDEDLNPSSGATTVANAAPSASKPRRNTSKVTAASASTAAVQVKATPAPAATTTAA